MYSERSAAIAAPPSRRRRPALACVHCRRRKVKCDQKKPCTQCQRSHGTVCTYSSDLKSSDHQNGDSRQDSRQAFQLGPRPHSQGGFQIPTPESSVAHSPFPVGPSNLSESCFAARPTTFSKQNLQPPVDQPLSKLSSSIASKFSSDNERNVIMQVTVFNSDRDHLKMKLVGEKHWMNDFFQFERLCSFIFETGRTGPSGVSSELSVLLQKCKSLGKIIKSERPDNWVPVQDYRQIMPAKEICDELVGNYLRNFESVHRILHVPSFQAGYNAYWRRSQIDSDTCHPFMMKLLLVMAIGTAFYRGPEVVSLRAFARQWVHAGQQWVSAPLEKSRMNLNGLQVYCLLILAREIVGVGSDLIWISAGTLLRIAMQLGYHRDPKHTPGISILHAELRRRLWATVIEMTVQESYNSAMPPLLSLDNFDTGQPANIDDIDLSTMTQAHPGSKPLTSFTQSSLQILLLQSFPVRLELSQITTNFRSDISYDDVLRFSSAITDACRETQTQILRYGDQASSFRLNHVDFLIRRNLLHIHRPFAFKARTDPRYYFSRKICLDTALTTISFAPSADYSRLVIAAQGAWRGNLFVAAMTIALELIMQLEEELINPPSAMNVVLAKTAREPLIGAMRESVDRLKERIKQGEMNVKGYLFVSMLLGQIEAMENGESPESGIAERAVRSLENSYDILRAKIPSSDDESVPIAYERSGLENNLEDQINVSSGFLEDVGLDFFDMPDTELFGDWAEQSWL